MRRLASAATETETGARTTRESDGSAWSRLAALPVGRHARWAVLIAWLALIVAAVPFASRASSVKNNEARTWLPADAESTRALDLGRRPFGSADVTPALVVYVRDTGLTAADVEKVQRDRTALAKYAHGQPGPATPDQDGRALLLVVPLRTTASDNRVLVDEVGVRLRPLPQPAACASVEVAEAI